MDFFKFFYWAALISLVLDAIVAGIIVKVVTSQKKEWTKWFAIKAIVFSRSY